MSGREGRCQMAGKPCERFATVTVDMFLVGVRDLCAIHARALEDIGMDMKVKQPRRLVVSGGAA